MSCLVYETGSTLMHIEKSEVLRMRAELRDLKILLGRSLPYVADYVGAKDVELAEAIDRVLAGEQRNPLQGAPACAYCSHPMVRWIGPQWQCAMTSCRDQGIVVTCPDFDDAIGAFRSSSDSSSPAPVDFAQLLLDHIGIDEAEPDEEPEAQIARRAFRHGVEACAALIREHSRPFTSFADPEKKP